MTLVWTLIAMAVVAGILYAQRADSRDDSLSGWSLAGGASSGALRISGFATGLYPGFWTGLRTRVKNNGGHAIAVKRIWVRVLGAGRGCPSRTLRVGRFKGRRLVGAGRTWRLDIPIAMLASAGEACQGARYPLIFFYRATRR